MSTNKRDKNHIFANKRRKLLGLDGGQLIKSYFGNSALVSILILSLITVFLFKEGIGFFGQNYQSLKLYRASALEYVDIIRSQNEGFLALNRYLNSIRTQQSKILDEEGYTFSEIQKEIKKDQAFYQNFSRLNKEMSQFIASIAEQAVGIREQAVININLKEKSDFIDDKIKRLRKKKKLNDSDRFELSQKLVQLILILLDSSGLSSSKKTTSREPVNAAWSSVKTFTKLWTRLELGSAQPKLVLF